MQCFDTPAARDELRREPIEQFGMTRLRATYAKIIRCRDDALTEVQIPSAVRHDARGKWIARVRQPCGKSGSALRFRRVRSQSKVAAQFGDGRESACSDDFLWRLHIAALEAMRGRRLHAGPRVGNWKWLQRIQLLPRRLDLRDGFLVLMSLIVCEAGEHFLMGN